MKGGKWLKDQIKEYAGVFPRYQRYAQILQKVLEKAVKIYAPLTIVQTRPKAISSFGEKALRKKFKYNYPVNQITDLCGGRVLTHTRAEVDALSEFIKKHFDIDWDNSLDVSQRLKPTEFGYRSIHYIVKFKPGVFPTRDIDIEIPEEVFGLKAEIQLKTILEHAWAGFSHDFTYKGAFEVPVKWERELAALAARLEAADSSFATIQMGLKRYAATYGAYMTEEQRRDEIDNLEIVLKYDPGNVDLVDRIGKLAIISGDFKKAINVLSKYVDSGYPPILRDLGVAMCKLHGANKESGEYRQGQKYLEIAVEKSDRDTDAIASLAGSWKGIDEDKARKLYHQAFDIDPSDPYPLGNYLEYELIRTRDISIVSMLKPVINNAIQRCRDQADVGINLPWAFYDIGKFYLLLGKPYESLSAYAKAIQLSTAEFMIDTSLQSHEKFTGIRNKLPGYKWVQKMLIVGLATKFPSDKWISKLKKFTSTSHKKLAGPIVIVAGGCDAEVEQQMKDYQKFLIDACRDFEGTIISGGTTAGISGLMGEVGQKYPDTVRTIGYLPKKIPSDVSIDRRYSETRHTEGDGFSPLEPLQYWIDILASGIPPAQIKLLGINGGVIAALEYKIALSLGAYVALVENSGREAAKLLKDDNWRTSKMLIQIPKDAKTILTYFGFGRSKMSSRIQETIAREIHENYRHLRARSLHTEDPAMADWSKLPKEFKESNRQQANNIFNMLRQIGCTVHKVTKRPVSLMTFSKDEIETMAKIEHARWNIERLLDGWTWAKERDVIKKTSPYLVSWSDVPDEIRELDRETVRKIPEFLAKVGLEVHRKT